MAMITNTNMSEQFPLAPQVGEEPAEQPQTRNGRAGRVVAKVAATVTAMAISFGAGAPATSSANSKSGVKYNVPVATQSPNKAEAKDRKPIDSEMYTRGVFDKWRKDLVWPSAFNGVVVMDGFVPLSVFIDPDKIGNHSASLNGLDNHKAIKNKYAVMKRPVFHIDNHGQTWVGVSNASNPNYAWAGVFRDARGKYRPVGQATEHVHWVWAQFDPKHMKLYEYTNWEDAPKGPRPFVSLNVSYADPSWDNQPLIDVGLVNNFVALSGRGPAIPPENIAAWGILDWDGERDGRPVNNGGKYVGSVGVRSYLSKLHIRPYKLSGNSKNIKKLMEQYRWRPGD